MNDIKKSAETPEERHARLITEKQDRVDRVQQRAWEKQDETRQTAQTEDFSRRLQSLAATIMCGLLAARVTDAPSTYRSMLHDFSENPEDSGEMTKLVEASLNLAEEIMRRDPWLPVPCPHS